MFLALFAAGAPLSRADVIVLRNGSRIVGTVLRQDERGVLLQTGPDSSIVVSLSDVAEIIHQRLPQASGTSDTRPPGTEAKVEVKTAPPEKAAPAEEAPKVTATPAKLPPLDPKLLAEVEKDLQALKREPPLPAEEVVRQLGGLGPSAIPCLVDALKKAPDKATEDVLMAALGSWKGSKLFSYLNALVTERYEEATKAAAWRVFGQLGDPENLEVLVPLTKGLEPGLLGGAESALGSILERNPTDGTYDTLDTLFSNAEPETKACLVRVLSRVGSPRGLKLLVEFLGRDNSLDLMIISRVGDFNPKAYPDGLLPKLRDALHRDSPAVRREAALALGKLRDFPSTAYLIDLLSDETPWVQEDALWALRNISGLRDFPAEPSRWRQWYEQTLAEMKNRQNQATTPAPRTE